MLRFFSKIQSEAHNIESHHNPVKGFDHYSLLTANITSAFALTWQKLQRETKLCRCVTNMCRLCLIMNSMHHR